MGRPVKLMSRLMGPGKIEPHDLTGFPLPFFDSLTGPRFLIGPQILYLANFGASRPRSITRLAHMPFGSEPAVVAPSATPAPSDGQAAAAGAPSGSPGNRASSPPATSKVLFRRINCGFLT